MTAARVSRRAFLRGKARPVLSVHTASSAADSAIEVGTSSIAQIDPASCLAASSQICTVCLERCGARRAIQLRGLYPYVDPERCTGCGDCARSCPAPTNAIALRARKETQ